MKTNKLLLVFTTIVLISLWLASTNAMYWNATNWTWRYGSWTYNDCDWTWNGSWKTSNSNTPWDSIANIEASDLSEQEKEDILYQYSEEMLARDIYNYFYELYGVNTFANIAESEQQHMDSVKVLIDRYDLDTPSDYGDLESTYETLKAEWELWLQEALEVWLKIEMLDIDDIVDTIESTDNEDIQIIFVNIGWASYNHLRWFAQALKNNSFETEIDISDYLDDTTTTWNLKDNLLEKLEEEWVSLSETVTSNLENCDNTNSNANQSQNRYSNETKKNAYKRAIGNKYSNAIKNMSQSAKNQLQLKLDTKIEEATNSTTMTDSEKENLISLYDALKEYLDEN